ncbi:hypothetical protein [Glutamicibacter halophytocola]|uniref:hypothetical protein n=1 Tax=Glutamicibacter halophytocola TaxID=1933880 RepID=UPI0015C53E09|nr:hypothetical protein [Glutamicibacter halophytocola]NQD41430.1 hypothetical protein [Glutamicibacter halophytocola]
MNLGKLLRKTYTVPKLNVRHFSPIIADGKHKTGVKAEGGFKLRDLSSKKPLKTVQAILEREEAERKTEAANL